MSIIIKLIVKYLLQNKKRNKIALGSILLSTLILTIFLSCGFWYYSYMKDIEIAINGSWQMRLYDLSEEQIEKLRAMDIIKNIKTNKASSSNLYTVDIELYSVNNDIFDQSQEIGRKLQMPIIDQSKDNTYMPNGEENNYNITYHEDLLDFYGITKSDSQISIRAYAIGSLSLILIMFSAFIYNTFSISFNEKRKYLGLLACAGASLTQRRLFILGQGLILGIIGIPSGLSFGLTIFRIILPYGKKWLEYKSGISTSTQLSWIPQLILMITILGILTIILAVIIPCINVKKITPLDYISRFRNIITPSGKVYSFNKKRTIEYNLAKKNVLYNKSHMSTMVGLLMLAFVFALNGYVYIKIQKGDYLIQDKREYKELDSWITLYSNDYTIEDIIVDELNHTTFVKNATYMSILNLGVAIYPNQYIDQDLNDFTFYGLIGKNPITHINNAKLENELYGFNTKVVGLEEKTFIEYAKKCNLEYNEYSDYQYPVIIEDYIPIREDKTSNQLYRSVLNIEEGERISVEFGKYADYVLLDNTIYGSEKQKVEFDVIGVTEETPPVPMDPEEYALKQNKYSQLEDSYITLYLPYSQFGKLINDDRVKQTYANMPQNINPVLWRESNPIKNYIYFDIALNSQEKQVKKEINKIASNIGLKENDLSLQKLSSDNENTWEYGNKKMLTNEVNENLYEISKRIFTLTTIVFITMFSISIWISYVSKSIVFRKREFAILKSMGMTYKQIKKMLVYEILTQVVISCVGGTVLGIIITLWQLYEHKKSAAIEITLPYSFVISEIFIAIILAVITAFISFKSVYKGNIIDDLKNEVVSNKL